MPSVQIRATQKIASLSRLIPALAHVRVTLQVLATFKAGEPGKVRTEDGEVRPSLFGQKQRAVWCT